MNDIHKIQELVDDNNKLRKAIALLQEENDRLTQELIESKTYSKWLLNDCKFI